MRTKEVCLAAVVAMTLALQSAAAEDALKISVPQRGAWDTAVTELGQRAGIFKKHGLVLDILYSQGGAESQQGVISGSLDIATAVGIDAAIGAYSKGAPLRIVGGEMIGSPDLYWYVPPGSPVRTIADLSGKTVGYSVTGSSSHSGLLGLLQQYGIDAKPVATGGMPATLTQTMTGQIDVGWAAAPFGLDQLEQGKIRIVARGSDVAARANRTVRVNVTNLQVLQNRADVVSRFMQAYRETVEWMYSDPAALKMYEEFSKVPERLIKTGRDEFFPQQAMWPDELRGLDSVLADSLKNKFITTPLSKDQLAELIRIPKPRQ
ncbi:MAG: ABC transporter substrate-binding protein [Xanthobacteraceae bacterium]